MTLILYQYPIDVATIITRTLNNLLWAIESIQHMYQGWGTKYGDHDDKYVNERYYVNHWKVTKTSKYHALFKQHGMSEVPDSI